MNKLFIDIETIPSGERPLPEEVKVPGTYKDPDKIKQYQKENVEVEFRKRSLITYKSEIICICYAIDDEPVHAIHKDLDDYTEEDMIHIFYDRILGTEQLQKDMQSAIIIGHNIMFDLKTIIQRFFKYGIHAPQVSTLTQYSPRVYDTMRAFTLGDRTDYVSLDEVSKFLGIEQTKSMHGSQVYDEYLAGNLAKIVDYCKGDVELVRKVYNKLII